MKTLDNKMIVYDSNCKVCSSMRHVILALTSIPEAKIVAFTELPSSLDRHVEADRFRNVMALVDTQGGPTLYGAEGVAYIFSSQYKIVDMLLRFKPFFLLFEFLYKTQAYNRYIMATPKSRFQCDCMPDRVVKYRVAYMAIAMLIAVALTAMTGIALMPFFAGLSRAEAAGQMLLMAGSGWVLQILLAALFMKDKTLDYLGHLSTIMVAGLLVLVPWMVFQFLTSVTSPFIPAISMLLSSGVMLYLHIGRARHLELSQGWTVSWFLLLQSCMWFWVWFFHLT